MIGRECKKVSIINDHIPRRLAKSDNKPKECVKSREGEYLKTLGRKYDRLNERQEETKTIQQWVVQLILKLAPISKYSQLETKRRRTGSML